MKVVLKYVSPLDMVVESCRTCYDTVDASDSKWTLIKDLRRYNSDQYVLGEKDKKRIQQCIDSGHTSVLEHSLIHYDISDIPRLTLQEFVRHRTGIAYSIQSTRFTLRKDLKNEPSFVLNPKDVWRSGDELWDWERAGKYIEISGIEYIDVQNIEALENVRELVIHNPEIPNDKLKLALPEVYKWKGRVSYNITSLRHFFKLRSAKDAHYIIRELAFRMYDALPEDYKFMFEDCMGETVNGN
jgi:thymidylate synthase (FAD)